jgi:serine/threonine protein kinase
MLTCFPQLYINSVYDIAYLPGTDVRPWLTKEYQELSLQQSEFPVPVIKEDMLIQLSNNLRQLHDCSIVHRYIKPSNVLMQLIGQYEKSKARNRWLYKWTRFGNEQYTKDHMSGLAGSPFFCAPEILND